MVTRCAARSTSSRAAPSSTLTTSRSPPFRVPRDHVRGNLGLTGDLTKDYGITWNAALETGGVLVSDKIVQELEISGIKNV